MSIIVPGAFASLAAGAMTAVGAIPVLFGRRASARTQDGLLGFAAGVMLAASFFSLIIPAIETSRQTHGGDALPAMIAVAGVVLGVVVVALVNELIPQGLEGRPSPTASKVWLFVAAITIHNFPEGAAVGVGYAGGDTANATALAVGIGLQNIPEGLAVAVALLAEGYSRRYTFIVAALSATAEPIGGFIGVTVVTLSTALLPWGLTFAAGAMIYVISHEIIPETHTRGHQTEATTGLTIGLAVMMFLDVTLGS